MDSARNSHGWKFCLLYSSSHIITLTLVSKSHRPFAISLLQTYEYVEGIFVILLFIILKNQCSKKAASIIVYFPLSTPLFSLRVQQESSAGAGLLPVAASKIRTRLRTEESGESKSWEGEGET